MRQFADRQTIDLAPSLPEGRGKTALIMLARQNPGVDWSASMSRKLFIVARGNTAVYGQLRRTVGREPGVEVIYDRRPDPPKPGKIRRLASAVKRALRPTRGEKTLAALGRRRRARVDADLKRDGWAVVHLDEPPEA